VSVRQHPRIVNLPAARKGVGPDHFSVVDDVKDIDAFAVKKKRMLREAIARPVRRDGICGRLEERHCGLIRAFGGRAFKLFENGEHGLASIARRGSAAVNKNGSGD